MKKRFVSLSIAFLSILGLAGCGNKNSKAINNLDDFKGSTLGCLLGSIHEGLINERYNNPKLLQYNTISDLCEALGKGKIDGFAAELGYGIEVCKEYPNYKVVDGLLGQAQLGFIFPKTTQGNALKAEMNSFLSDYLKTEDYGNLKAMWFDKPESERVPFDYSTLPATKGTLKYATIPSVSPYAYVKGNGTYEGFDISIVCEFCKHAGYAITFEGDNLKALLPTVAQSKVDFGGGCIAITEERKESLYFSNPYSYSDIIMIAKNPKGIIKKPSEFAGKRIGILNGSIHDENVIKYFNGDAEISYYNSCSDLVYALNKGKIDAFGVDIGKAFNTTTASPNLACCDELISNEDIAFGFRKDNTSLRDEFNTFLNGFKYSGKLEKLKSKWYYDKNPKVDYSIESLNGSKGTIRLGTSYSIGEPYIYLLEDGPAGIDIDLIINFCKECGYKLEVTNYDFKGLISALEINKADIASGCLTITEERKQAMLFSNVYCDGGCTLVYKCFEEKTDFFKDLAAKFEATFIKESRYKLFLEGIGNTMLICLISIVLGTLLGFLLYLPTYFGSKVMTKFNKAYKWLIDGLPIVVLLMILYYIIFGTTSLTGVTVSIIGFSLVFASGVLGNFMASVSTVPNSQLEAGLALGFTRSQTFFKVILPQSMTYFFPSFKKDIISLIKATAVVGYIAVADLTQMSDIVRSRTYDAFFPLIATAIIYFILSAVLTRLVRLIEIPFNPKKRKKEKILKGVDTHDRA